MISESTVEAGIGWRVATAGPEDGARVLLLHGFPEYRRAWDTQLEALADRGFRAYAADLPGYGASDAPRSYRLDHVARLVAELALTLDASGVHLVGHDWGGIIGHATAFLRPDAVRSLVAACAPHPGVLTRALRDPRQLTRSWYVGAFQIPGIEHVFAGRRSPARSLFEGAISDMRSVHDFRRGIAYYRANLAPWKLRHGIGRISQPALVIHAASDRYIGHELMEATAAECDDLRGFEVIACGHFLHWRCPDEFNSAVVGFLGEVAEA